MKTRFLNKIKYNLFLQITPITSGKGNITYYWRFYAMQVELKAARKPAIIC